ncbi:serine/threonine protein kinase [Coniosporium apollinis CBS 100218]|uniref:non-specific serine/threonine protein kinase n=1 Tax=Coniosporium apollinis (strain CBS 100218) TaxID=1168221 RepID=R7YIX5_CONA1|nr:serine/threonine protein kinase [Coniosporium apollinis CBS 100218]EON61571.1 serine/threonine protein kinase [Coniosporium apollinis CBS 100218]
MKNLVPSPFDELNWSGRGQHVEYMAGEEHNIPLQVEGVLGYSKAVVERVRCRRIILAQKTIRCSPRISKEEALQEVEHLQRLSHSHIVRLVGTYIIARKLCILMYPAAEYDLDGFLVSIQDGLADPVRSSQRLLEVSEKQFALTRFFGCLASAVQYVHDSNTKHMDIKPKNIIVKAKSSGGNPAGSHRVTKYKVYLTDFEIARTYECALESETDTPIACSRPYAAPEVVLQTIRGFKSDIFSLGCVFAEMVATLYSTVKNDYRQHLRDMLHGDTSYQAHTEDVQKFVRTLLRSPTSASLWPTHDVICGSIFGDPPETSCAHFMAAFSDIFELMLDQNPARRPTAVRLGLLFRQYSLMCGRCYEGPEPFEAVSRI